MFVFLLVTTVILYLLYIWFTMRPRNFPPGPIYLPFIGSAPFMTEKRFHLLMERWRDQYGPVVGLLVSNTPAIAVVDPTTAVSVLKREEFQGRPDIPGLREQTFNKRIGVMFNDGPLWMEQRRFTLRHLKDFGFGKASMEGLIIKEIEELMDELRNKTVQVSGLFNLSSVNVLWAVMAGTRYKRDDPELLELLENLTRSFRSGNSFGSTLRVVFPFLKYIFPNLGSDQIKVAHQIHRFIRNVIEEHYKTLDENSPRDFIDVYINEMRKQPKDVSTFTEEELIVICKDLFAAGSESVGNSLGFALLYMVLYPEIQEKVQAALDSHIGHARMPSLKDKPSLPYVEAVLLEVIRRNTIAPLTVPHRATRDTELNGYFIPKDTTVILSLWSLLMDKKHWENPEHFRPERFLDNTGKLIKDEWFIPFGVGKRLCPGEALARNTLYLMFTSLLQEFKISLPPGHSRPSTLSLPGFTVAPQPFEVVFTPR